MAHIMEGPYIPFLIKLVKLIPKSEIFLVSLIAFTSLLIRAFDFSTKRVGTNALKSYFYLN